MKFWDVKSQTFLTFDAPAVEVVLWKVSESLQHGLISDLNLFISCLQTHRAKTDSVSTQNALFWGAIRTNEHIQGLPGDTGGDTHSSTRSRLQRKSPEKDRCQAPKWREEQRVSERCVWERRRMLGTNQNVFFPFLSTSQLFCTQSSCLHWALRFDRFQRTRLNRLRSWQARGQIN